MPKKTLPSPPAPNDVAEYNIRELPSNVVLGEKNEQGMIPPVAGKLVWSGDKMPPAIGDRVVATVNRIGAGVVESYFREHGYLGVAVRVENPPDWFVKQNKGKWYEGVALIMGAETQY
jgi:hypothetical protein